MAATKIIIFQNYYTPARDALFRELHGSGIELMVLYAHQPGDEGRLWSEPDDVPYRSIQLRHISIFKNVLFLVPLFAFTSGRIVILLDNNPTNLCMIAWAVIFRLFGCKIGLWVEHIPDQFKGRLKLIFQETSTRILSKLSNVILSFSEMSDKYLNYLQISRPIRRMIQAVPPPSRPPSPPIRGPIRSFGYLGSADRRKNVQALVAAFSKLPDPSLRLHVGGFSGVSEDVRIVWHGYVVGDDKEEFFNNIQLLVIPSLADPWGLVANEALERQRLVIATDACGCSEMINFISPELVCSNDVIGLSSSLEWASTLSVVQVTQLIERSYEVIEKYSISAAAKRFSDIVKAF
ncbi:glycosyltransferase family 4 protein [Ancylobacter sp. MQZ15Z-1]|uniref:Glycosyltransferase family 4 protein n=1 Tax=Ancylobacter mangrovi TaxID=2972472 RepID=A0A9X2PKD9_9HYPH|nr:glycosyltransferase family 4 protein [Ancylobacter mangrovi]MCS0496877.1 glycosyltransferase family 4 protein [Ancylobacter mangrovi]